MKKFKNILFPVNFLESEPLVADYISELLKSYKFKLHLLHVIDLLNFYSRVYFPGSTIRSLEKTAIDGAYEKMRQTKQLFSDLNTNIETQVVIGDIPQMIQQYIDDNDIDLVVMGTHGRSGFARIIHGSIAEQVFDFSPIPVLTVNLNKSLTASVK